MNSGANAVSLVHRSYIRTMEPGNSWSITVDFVLSLSQSDVQAQNQATYKETTKRLSKNQEVCDTLALELEKVSLGVTGQLLSTSRASLIGTEMKIKD